MFAIASTGFVALAAAPIVWIWPGPDFLSLAPLAALADTLSILPVAPRDRR